MSKQGSRPFLIEGADGNTFEIPPGDWYRSTKARPQRMMRNSLSSEARRVYACLELATIGFSREKALIGTRPLTRSDIAKQTGLSEANVRRALIELEEAGLAERRGMEDGPLHKGRVEIYSWATPRPPKEKKRESRATPIPAWFPKSWASLDSLRKRLKLVESIQCSDALLAEGAEIAAALKKAEDQAKEFLAKTCTRQNGHDGPPENGGSAPPENPPRNGVSALQNGVSALQNGVSAAPENARIRERTEITEITPPPTSPALPAVFEEEEDIPSPSSPPKCLPAPASSSRTISSTDELYAIFKSLYPHEKFDPNAKAAFRKLSPTEQRTCIERLHIWLKSDYWADRNGQWIKLASNWLKSDYYLSDPPPPFRPAEKNGNYQDRGFVASVTRVIGARLAKGEKPW